IASSSKAASGPKIMSTLSRSISSCALVLVPAGFPPVSAISSSAGRPASLLPRCLRNSPTPGSIGKPPCASGPVFTVRRPIFTGEASAIAGIGKAAASAAAAPLARTLRLSTLDFIGWPRAYSRWRNLATKHRKDQLPIAVGGLLIVDVAIGQRVTMLSAGVDLVPVTNRAVRQKLP